MATNNKLINFLILNWHGFRRGRFYKRVLRNSSIRKYGIATMTLSIVAVSVLVSVYGVMRRTALNTVLATTDRAVLNTRNEKKRQRETEAELITVTRAGFEPSDIKRPRGSFILVIDDRSGTDGLTCRIDRLSGGVAHNLKRSKGAEILLQAL